MEQKRESLGSRMGFILLSAGCAIGLGNIWTFPWRVGNNGGGAFVLLYVIALIILGLPVMVAEFSIGRGAQKSPVIMYQQLEKKNAKFHWHGPMSLIGNVALMGFYTTIAGYFFHYFLQFIFGHTETLTYESTQADIGVNLGFMALVVILGFFVLSFKLQKGLERVNKVMMVALFALLVGLAIYSCTMSGAGAGLSFYLIPDFSQINGNVVVAAMNQAFFSLSLGMGSMAIFGSYIKKDRSLLGESVNIVILDSVVALLAGFIIFPACFSLDITPDAGPSLLFTTMTRVFNSMEGGRIIGSLFFLFMIFAAMSTVFAVFENILAMIRDLTGWSRKKACIICGIGMLLISTPMALGANALLSFQPFSHPTDNAVLDVLSFIVEKIVQPVGSFIYLVFVCNKRYGWGWDNFLAEANAGKGLQVRNWMKIFFKYITPVIIFAIWIYGLVTYSY